MFEYKQKSRIRRRHAITLLEMLLVLAVLVVLAGLAYPALERALAAQSLRSAADELRTVWARARLQALESGTVQLFRFALGGRRYRVESLDAQGLPQIAITGSQSLGVGPAFGLANSSPYPVTQELPEDVLFLDGTVQLDMQTTYYAMQLLENETTGFMDDTAVWSDPIVFFPDGTTSTAAVTISNQHGRCVELSLRGLTGVVSVGDPFTSVLIQ